MSEEEKKAIELLKLELAGTIKANECGLATKGEYDNEIKAYSVVFNLIEKQQKEIEEYEKNRLWSEATINGLKNDFVPKQKIKDKIDELEKKQFNEYKKHGYSDNYYHIVSEISVLEELLKEE